jgi:4-amino-4-deoxy-L-arabinose transferase-like glycosyltransferase
MTTPKKLARGELLALVAIVLLASFLRLAWPGVNEFKLDEAQIMSMTLDLVEGRAFPTRGIETSVGLPKPAISIYLYALPVALWRSPLSATLFTALLNILAVGLCWWLTRRYWGRAAGLCAGAFLAAAPWAVFSSRKIWEPNLFPLLALVCVTTGLLGFRERRAWAQAAHMLALGLTVQVHYPGLLLLPVSAVLVVANWRGIRWRAVGLGLGLALLSAIPFVYDLVKHRREIMQVLATTVSQPAVVNRDALDLLWMLCSGRNLHALAGPERFRDYLASVPSVEISSAAAGALVVLGAAGLAISALQSRTLPAWQAPIAVGDTAAAVAVLAWLLTPLLAFTRHSTPVQLHYFTVALPAAAIAAGAGLGWLVRTRWRGVRGVTVAVLLLLVGAQTWQSGAMLSLVENTYTPGGFGMPLKIQLAVAESARAQDAPVIVVAPGDNPAMDEWPAVFDVLLRDVPHRFINGQDVATAVFPTAATTLLFTPGTDDSWRIYAREGPRPNMRRIPARPGEGRFLISREPTPRAPLMPPSTDTRLLSNGVQFVGYYLDPPLREGGTVEWWLAWRVSEARAAPGADYHLFNHLVDATGKRWAQVDGGTVPSRDWQVGDIVVQLFRLQVPTPLGPGPFTMRVGMYTYPGLENQRVLDVAGNPADEAVTLGPLP